MNRRKAMRTARAIVLALAVLVALGLLGIAGYVWLCQRERWSVKTGSDHDAGWRVDQHGQGYGICTYISYCRSSR